MQKNWTDEQLDAIRSVGGTVVVSAAAGSGKTAVLIERIIRRLTDEEHPCSADQLLIVTFTKAATAEMRSRLSSAISEKLREDPGNKHLQNQQMLIPSADICTIDSFCCNLVRENFNVLSVTPDFRLLDQSEEDILQSNALDKTLDYYFNERYSEFESLADIFKTNYGEGDIGNIILKLYSYSRAYPSPSKWLDSAARLYSGRLNSSEPLFSFALKYIEEAASRYLELIEGAIQYFRELGNFDTKYAKSCENNVSLFQSEKVYFKSLIKFAEARDIDGIISVPGYASFGRFSAVRGMKGDPEYSKYSTGLRDSYKKFILDINSVFSASLEETNEDNKIVYPLIKLLVEAVRRFSENYAEEKRLANAIDFSDAELMALSLLVEDPADDEIHPTKLARELSEKYTEILIDEYQDTNKLQDMLFTAISKNGNNMFMVGDVKQSIYRFRQAMPEIFIDKTTRFSRYNRDCEQFPASVILSKNFRSRKGVLEAVNYCFSQLMSKDIGDLDYNEDERLNYGRTDFAEADEPDAEFHIVECPGSNAEQAAVAEALEIGNYILKTMSDSINTDSPLNYRDFTILLRSPKSNGKAYAETLSDMGIPVYVESTSRFFQSADIASVLSLLKAIDNPLTDIPLASVMLSPLFGFTPDDLAEYKINSRAGSLYSAVIKAADKGSEKCIYLTDKLDYYKTLSVSMTTGELIRQIYEDTAIVSVAEAMPNGSARAANLQMLLNYADKYDSVSTYGLPGFIRYLSRLEDADRDLESASSISPEANVVRIMSMHKSKGLQFKVCILANLSKSFNTEDIKQKYILHPRYGIGMKIIDPEIKTVYPTLVYSTVKFETARSQRSEDLRLLYVAMTRAEQKLVMFGTASSFEKDIESLEKIYAVTGNAKTVPAFQFLNSGTALKNYYRMLMAAFIRHPDADCLFENLESDQNYVLDSGCHIGFELHKPEERVLSIVTGSSQEKFTDEDIDAVKSKVTYEYPYAALAGIPAKRSASGIESESFNDTFFAKARPKFMSKKSLTPAERGTALHNFMQYADFANAESDPDAEVSRLCELGSIQPQQAAVIDTEKVRRFFRSSVARRIKDAAQVSPDNVMREKKFALLVDAGLFDSTLSDALSKEQVLIQGIADLCFIENGELVIVDYKTDSVKTGEELAELYTHQLEVYRMALQEVMEIPVKETLLYSFSLGAEVTIFKK